ncbi:hypothetical protein BJ508DRAFT_49401 [Ascobolus immersus RN42]|uniref:Uncharacterized protein n=1 Tax=Ascobolus immersus RN42 TaxID=1160509 RepID=A0A3N4HV56_ASCIM|nr:hypothetical protein BJ508DRAFT_49401 [Ascobolus immersus RN42]
MELALQHTRALVEIHTSSTALAKGRISQDFVPCTDTLRRKKNILGLCRRLVKASTRSYTLNSEKKESRECLSIWLYRNFVDNQNPEFPVRVCTPPCTIFSPILESRAISAILHGIFRFTFGLIRIFYVKLFRPRPFLNVPFGHKIKQAISRW